MVDTNETEDLKALFALYKVYQRVTASKASPISFQDWIEARKHEARPTVRAMNAVTGVQHRPTVRVMRAATVSTDHRPTIRAMNAVNANDMGKTPTDDAPDSQRIL